MIYCWKTLTDTQKISSRLTPHNQQIITSPSSSPIVHQVSPSSSSPIQSINTLSSILTTAQVIILPSASVYNPTTWGLQRRSLRARDHVRESKIRRYIRKPTMLLLFFQRKIEGKQVWLKENDGCFQDMFVFDTYYRGDLWEWTVRKEAWNETGWVTQGLDPGPLWSEEELLTCILLNLWFSSLKCKVLALLVSQIQSYRQ